VSSHKRNESELKDEKETSAKQNLTKITHGNLK
jgi:hypothetical protein